MLRFGLFISLLLSSPIWANEYKTDVREQCRSLIGGRYLAYVNDLDVLQSSYQATQASVQELVTRKRELEARLKAGDQKREDADIPEASLDQDLLGYRNELDGIREDLKAREQRRDEVQAQLVQTEKDFSAFRLSIQPIFELAKGEGIDRGAYPMAVAYRHSCPKYAQLCPLPADQAKKLLELASGFESGLPCARYASLEAKARP